MSRIIQLAATLAFFGLASLVSTADSSALQDPLKMNAAEQTEESPAKVFEAPASPILMAQRRLPRKCRDLLDDMQDNTEALLYIASYPDLVAKFGADPDAGRRHFQEYGCDEGRDITFDPLAYVAGYGDLIRRIGLNEQMALEHYFKFGAKEGRSSAKFDYRAYANRYGDLNSKFGNNKRRLVEHCIRYGFKESREFCG